MISAIPMLTRCFEHQHPEAFGRQRVPEAFPVETHSTASAPAASSDYTPEERHPNAQTVPLAGEFWA